MSQINKYKCDNKTCGKEVDNYYAARGWLCIPGPISRSNGVYLKSRSSHQTDYLDRKGDYHFCSLHCFATALDTAHNALDVGVQEEIHKAWETQDQDKVRAELEQKMAGSDLKSFQEAFMRVLGPAKTVYSPDDFVLRDADTGAPRHVCCKCGAWKIGMSYRPKQSRYCTSSSNEVKCTPKREHLHYTCQTCHYEWHGDLTGPDGQEEGDRAA